MIKAAIDRGASDLHIKAGDVFRARIDGKLVALTKHRLTAEQTKAIAQHLISSDEDRARLDRLRDYDCSWGMRSEEHTSEFQSHSDLVCRLLLEKKNDNKTSTSTQA